MIIIKLTLIWLGDNWRWSGTCPPLLAQYSLLMLTRAARICMMKVRCSLAMIGADWDLIILDLRENQLLMIVVQKESILKCMILEMLDFLCFRWQLLEEKRYVVERWSQIIWVLNHLDQTVDVQKILKFVKVQMVKYLKNLSYASQKKNLRNLDVQSLILNFLKRVKVTLTDTLLLNSTTILNLPFPKTSTVRHSSVSKFNLQLPV